MTKFHEKSNKYYLLPEFKDEFRNRYRQYGLDVNSGYPEQVITDMLESTFSVELGSKLKQFKREILNECCDNIVPLKSLLSIECLTSELEGNHQRKQQLMQKLQELIRKEKGD